jgi:hypothetical protein
MRVVGHLTKEQIGKETQKPKKPSVLLHQNSTPKNQTHPKNQTPTVFLHQSSTLQKTFQIPAKITALLKPLLLLLLFFLLSSSSSFLLLLLLLLLEQNKILKKNYE